MDCEPCTSQLSDRTPVNTCLILKQQTTLIQYTKRIPKYAIPSLLSSFDQSPFFMAKYQQEDGKETPAALSVHGPDAGLDPVETLKLLRSNVILLLFSPSIDFLRSLKSAIRTVLDLPRIELEDGVPLVIYVYV